MLCKIPFLSVSCFFHRASGHWNFPNINSLVFLLAHGSLVYRIPERFCYRNVILGVSMCEMMQTNAYCTVPETNIFPENGWLEYQFPLVWPIFRAICLFQEGYLRLSAARQRLGPHTGSLVRSRYTAVSGMFDVCGLHNGLDLSLGEQVVC